MRKTKKADDSHDVQKSRKGIGSRKWIDSAYDIERPAKGKRPF